ncbi:MAG TPA: hypothetical protein VF268_05905 [Gammaproteobacteria bacterium]
MPVTLSLFLPGLLGPVSGEIPPDTLPRAEAFTGLLAAATRRGVARQNPLRRLAEQFGVAAEPPPVAALSYLADFGRLPAQHCFRCDPVHLQADMAQALLYDSRSFDIPAREAGQLIDAFNRHFAEDNLKLVFRDPRRWYLLTDNPPPLLAPPLDEVVGRNAGAFLPEELAAARYWNRVLNETQMLFFGHPLNLERESRGEPAVNGVWIYGGGLLNGGGPAAYQAVYSDDAFCRGLALHAGVPVRPWAAVFETGGWREEGSVLLFDSGLRDALLTGDMAGWSSRLAEWETRLFTPLHQQWRAGKLGRVMIDPDNGYQYQLTAGGLGNRFRGLLRGAFHRLGGRRAGLAAFIDKSPPGNGFRP